MQAHMNPLMTLASADIWARCIQNIPKECFQVVPDCMSTPSLTTATFVCGRRSQTCPHCATGVCKISSTSSLPAQLLWTREGTMLDTTQFYASLSEMVEKHLPTTASMSVDLPVAFNYPLHIVPTSLHPGVMLSDDTQRWIYLVEFTVCFETI